jgi:hypothetical protein
VRENVRGVIEGTVSSFSWRTEEIHEEPVSVAGVPAQIPNTVKKCNRSNCSI